MIKIYWLVLLFLIISIPGLYTSAFADSSNSTKQVSIFSITYRDAQSNTYQDEIKHFSISPPQNWSILKNIPASISDNSLVVFSNKNHTGLATFSIYYKPISQQIINVLDTNSDKDVVSEIAKELSYNGSDSQTVVVQSGIARYKDGILIKAVSLTQYSNDTNRIQNEHLIFFLNDGREYTLLLTSKSQDFNQNQIYFETSANTFYVVSNENSTQHEVPKVGPSVPEFGPFVGIIITISILGVIVLSRKTRLHFF